MFDFKPFLAAAAVLASATAAQAVTVANITEGQANRAVIAGSTGQGDVVDLDIGALSVGDDALLYGRAGNGGTDIFSFTLTQKTMVNLNILGGGLPIAGGGTRDPSGLTRESGTGLINFVFRNAGGADIVSTSLDETTTAITALSFSGTAGGDYELVVTGPTGTAADNFFLYDVQIAAVPLPGSALLLLAGLSGLGAVARRRRKA